MRSDACNLESLCTLQKRCAHFGSQKKVTDSFAHNTLSLQQVQGVVGNTEKMQVMSIEFAIAVIVNAFSCVLRKFTCRAKNVLFKLIFKMPRMKIFVCNEVLLVQWQK